MERTYTWDELLAAVRRRWKVMALIAGGALALAAVVIARIPNEYRARALVMVESATPHPDLVVPVLDATSLESKVKSVRAQVYSRSVMATAIDELKLYQKDRDDHGMDAAIEAFRADTEVHAEGDDAFAITVKARDPETAARAANRLAELYIEGNLQVRAGQVTRTRDIITGKLNELRAELAKAEGKVNAYKQQHADTLPELVDARLHEREQLARQIDIENGVINGAQGRIDLLGTQPFGKDTEVGRLEEEYDIKRATLGAAQAQLTPDHPDVQRLQRDTQATYARLNAARQRAAANDLELRRMNDAIKRSQNHIAELQKREQDIDKLIAAAPLTAAGLSDLARDVDLIKAKVGSLTSKKAEAEITAELEMKSAPSEFRVLESAQPPTLAAMPNRSQLLLIALLGALALGAAVALGQELSDRSFRTEHEAGTAIALPVLACVPQLVGAQAARTRLLTIHSGSEA